MNNLAKKIHENAKSKGFWDNPREVGTLLMLCVSELSEALEADRENRYADLTAYKEYQKETDIINHFEYFIKDTFEDEIADTIIRLLDLCGAKGIDIDWHIKEKMKYNANRAYLHGKNY